MTSSRRLSKRTAAVKNRKLLEKKLNERSARRQLQFSSSRESLAWDSSNDRDIPSFASNFPDAVADSISESEIDEDSYFSSKDVNETIRVRNRASTDPDFLERSLVSGIVEPWPPREPSAEPEILAPFSPTSIQLNSINEILDDEVFPDGLRGLVQDRADSFNYNPIDAIFPNLFDDLSTPLASFTMDENTYKSKLKDINVAERKVIAAVRRFPDSAITVLDVENYLSKLADIDELAKVLDELIIELICDLDPSLETDKAKSTELEKKQNALNDSVVKNTREVKEKIHEYLSAKNDKKRKDNDPPYRILVRRKRWWSKRQRKRC